MTDDLLSLGNRDEYLKYESKESSQHDRKSYGNKPSHKYIESKELSSEKQAITKA